MGAILGFSNRSGETLNRGLMIIFQDKLLTSANCDKAGDLIALNVLGPRDLVFRPEIGHELYHYHTVLSNIFTERVIKANSCLL